MLRQKLGLLGVAMGCITGLWAQGDSTKPVGPDDTLQVVVRAFGQYRQARLALPSVHALQGAALDRLQNSSLLPALNTLPGVRMEERSPGSYRLNLRGSSLRSPFGVRNVKVYYNMLPLTDAGGNTYFNQLAPHHFQQLEVATGPGGSMYGAGTGGVVLLYTPGLRQNGWQAALTGGSFGLLQAVVQGQWQQGNTIHYAAAGYTSQQGYRTHTRMQRANASYSTRLLHTPKLQLHSHLLASHLDYQTPGGLTLQEWNQNPRQARPRVGTQPSAQEAAAVIFQQNLLAGLQLQWKPGKGWQQHTGVYGSLAQVRNPAIRNYEQRSEPGWGLRSVFTRTFTGRLPLTFDGGAEAQWGNFNTRVFTNRQGQKGSPLSHDNLLFFTWNAFAQLKLALTNRWEATAGISYFENRVRITRKLPATGLPKQQTGAEAWSPRFTLIYRPANSLQLSGLVSRGFSPPTVSELLPSTGIINTALRPEYGWNYELGLRWQLPSGRWGAGVNYFRFMLQDALVQRRDSSGADFYTNAGGTRQQGIEAYTEYLHILPTANALQLLRVKAAYTYNHFTYSGFVQLNSDFSGNTLPSVPAHTLSVMADIKWQSSFFVNTTYYTASAIWLNDANTARAKPYHLLGFKAGYGKKQMQFFAGADNLLNQTYSLGHDINAFGGRFFNAAPGINWFAGVKANLPAKGSRQAGKP